jgi:SAM-dependent methyltransferase
MMGALQSGSIIVPSYQSGDYYATHKDPEQDSPFKVEAFLKVWRQVSREREIHVRSYADVGCGGGGVANLVGQRLRADGETLHTVTGYDVSPHVLCLRHEGVRFHFEDFCQADTHYDLVTLFDVMEHVPDPVSFLKEVAARCNFIALHIPLDRNWVNCFFDRFRKRLTYPGHLVALDTPMALTLVALGGITALDYSYTHGYSAPSGTMTKLQKLAFPFRAVIAGISPWMASRLTGGVSLMVIGATPSGLSHMRF